MEQQYLTLKNGRKILIPDAAEEARINAGIAADPDTFEPTDEQFAQMRRVGRPVALAPKQHINLRLSPDVMDAFKATGKGWQTRIGYALQDWLKTHNAADARGG